MSPIDTLREGIREQSWDRVRAGFAALTGENIADVAAPAPKKTTKSKTSVKPVAAKPIKKTQPEVANRFVDDHTLCVEDIKQSRKTSKKFKKKETRNPFQPVDVVCVRCQKKEAVHPDLAPKRLDATDELTKYICSGCIKGVK